MAGTTHSQYFASYESLPPNTTSTNRYLVQFREGHTIWKHFEAIGGPFNGTECQNLEYRSTLDDQQRERVRHDPGVKKVIQVTADMEFASIQANRSVIIYPHSKYEDAPGYIVSFTSKENTYYVREHLKRISLRVDGTTVPGVGYWAELSDAQIDAIFADPNVHNVARRMWGRFTDYLAPYEPLPPGNTSRVDYIVNFHEGHTIWKHFDWMGGPFRGLAYQHLMYMSPFHDEEIERVRRDPGVKLVEQADREKRDDATRANRSVITAPGAGAREAPGYSVSFIFDTYTLQEHLERTGLSFEADVKHSMYWADLNESQIQAVFTDPNVDHITKNMYGRYP